MLFHQVTSAVAAAVFAAGTATKCLHVLSLDEVRVMLQQLVRSIVAHCFDAVNCHNNLPFFPVFWHTKTFTFSSLRSASSIFY